MNIINQTVNVDAFYFTGHDTVKAFPRRMQLNTKAYTFEDGLQRMIRKGQRVVQLFDMTDGQTRFRLKLENDQWTLIGTQSKRSSASRPAPANHFGRNLNGINQLSPRRLQIA